MIFITGDTHGKYDIKKLNSKSFPLGKQLTKDDMLLLPVILDLCGLVTELNHYFDIIEETAKYKHWYFGHNHLDEFISENQTIVYNKVIRII